MSFKINEQNGHRYVYFQMGSKGVVFLGKEGEVAKKPNVQNILKSLEYVNRKNSHYCEVEDQLIAMLPEPERKEYLSKRTAELLARLRRLQPKKQNVPIQVQAQNLSEELNRLFDSIITTYSGDRKMVPKHIEKQFEPPFSDTISE